MKLLKFLSSLTFQFFEKKNRQAYRSLIISTDDAKDIFNTE